MVYVLSHLVFFQSSCSLATESTLLLFPQIPIPYIDYGQRGYVIRHAIQCFVSSSRYRLKRVRQLPTLLRSAHLLGSELLEPINVQGFVKAYESR